MYWHRVYFLRLLIISTSCISRYREAGQASSWPTWKPYKFWHIKTQISKGRFYSQSGFVQSLLFSKSVWKEVGNGNNPAVEPDFYRYSKELPQLLLRQPLPVLFTSTRGFEPPTPRLGAGLSLKKARKGGRFRAPIFVVTHFVTQLWDLCHPTLRRWDLKPSDPAAKAVRKCWKSPKIKDFQSPTILVDFSPLTSPENKI